MLTYLAEAELVARAGAVSLILEAPGPRGRHRAFSPDRRDPRYSEHIATSVADFCVQGRKNIGPERGAAELREVRAIDPDQYIGAHSTARSAAVR